MSKAEQPAAQIYGYTIQECKEGSYAIVFRLDDREKDVFKTRIASPLAAAHEADKWIDAHSLKN